MDRMEELEDAIEVLEEFLGSPDLFPTTYEWIDSIRETFETLGDVLDAIADGGSEKEAWSDTGMDGQAFYEAVMELGLDEEDDFIFELDVEDIQNKKLEQYLELQAERYHSLTKKIITLMGAITEDAAHSADWIAGKNSDF